MHNATERALIDAVVRRYRPAGPMALYFASGKLRHDPIFFALLRRVTFPDELRLVDLGCGQGLLLALLVEARALALSGRWPRDWPSPPAKIALRGIERWPAEVARARVAIGGDVAIDALDLRDALLEPCECVTLIDVVHYLEPDAQDELLARIHGALVPGGQLIMRVGDASAGIRAFLTRATDHLGAFMKGGRAGRMHLRSIPEWVTALEARGFSAHAEPMNEGTPFANSWIVARVSC